MYTAIHRTNLTAVRQRCDSENEQSAVAEKTSVHEADSNATGLTMTAQVQQW